MVSPPARRHIFYQLSKLIISEDIMTIGRAVTLLAGTLVLVSLLLSQLHSPYWLWLTAFVGLNLVQSSFTGFCPAAMIFKVLGVKPGGAFS
jgi:hypothetical protein